MTHGSLFAGIGGFDLGFEWAGIKTLWQVEIDDYCQRVLAKHWPDVERFGDIKGCGKHNLKEVDIISGGFPCQDISIAGKQAGIEGSRSGLWSDMHRIIGELRPRYTVIENVPNLIRLGLERVLCDLAEIGYDAEWQVVGADDIGAPHRRKRIWIVAYPRDSTDNAKGGAEREAKSISGKYREAGRSRVPNGTSDDTKVLANTSGKGLERREETIQPQEERNSNSRYHRSSLGSEGGNDWWSTEPDVGRVAHGVPSRVDRLKGLGNAIVPQIAEIIGGMIRVAR